ncbi:hypothetical protein SLA2020_214980 [Shorea laevis]
MDIPMIDFDGLHGKRRSKTMAVLNHSCERWGIFQVGKSILSYMIHTLYSPNKFLTSLLIENHGINKKLMEKVKQLANS